MKQNMRINRKFDVDVEDVELKYRKWWKAYENVCADLSKEKRDSSLKRQMLDESEGLLGALRLPNDLAPETPMDDASLNVGFNGDPPKHMVFLRKAGMVKVDESTSSVYTIGLPTSLHSAVEKAIVQHFSASSMLISPPHMVRGAVIEAVNVPKETFPSFSSSGDTSSNYLTGHGLISLLSVFTKTHFAASSNQWPIHVLSSGSSYRNSSTGNTKPNLYEASQRKIVALLSICVDEGQECAEMESLVDEFEGLLKRSLGFPIKETLLMACQLHNYESCATSFVYGEHVEVGRISRSGTYIPSRLNIVHDSKDVGKVEFVHLVYAEIDITRLVGMIVEENIMGEQPVANVIAQLL
ncbi:unnamed protein product [Toxocara canis]|uniref:Uncharacterized protein n=1 Tax=Toxocara canis TaxID=6265 RepID=A0A183V4E5_TOXCA|nr:unnamed protein product [Toxocara canis]